MRQLPDGLVVDDALCDRLADQLVDEGDAVALLDFAQGLPAQHHRTVDEYHPLHGGLRCGFEKSVQTAREPFPWVRAGRGSGDGPQREVVFDVFEHGPKQLGLVLEVVVEGTARAHARLRHEVTDARVEESVFHEQFPARLDQVAASLLATGTPIVVRTTALRHADDRSNIQLEC